ARCLGFSPLRICSGLGCFVWPFLGKQVDLPFSVQYLLLALEAYIRSAPSCEVLPKILLCFSTESFSLVVSLKLLKLIVSRKESPSTWSTCAFMPNSTGLLAFVAGGVHQKDMAVVHVPFPAVEQHLLDPFPLAVFLYIFPHPGEDGGVPDLFVLGQKLAAEHLEAVVGVEPFDKLSVADVEVGFEEHQREHPLGVEPLWCAGSRVLLRQQGGRFFPGQGTVDLAEQ